MRMKSWFFGFLALSVCAGGALMAGRALVEDARAMLQQAESAYKVRNYNEAIKSAKALIETNPTTPETKKAERILGLSHFGLRQFDEAYQRLSDLVTRHEEYAKDATVVEALALAGRDSGRVAGTPVVDALNRAISLYEAERNTRKQLDLLFQLAEYYTNGGHLHQIRQQGKNDWQAQSLDSVARALETYDRALKVGGEIADQLRSLRGKVQVLLNYGHQLAQYPREKWPAGLTTAYELDKPFDLAIEFDREIVRRWPERPSAAESLDQIGDIQAQYKNDLVSALATYQELVKNYPRSPQVAGVKQKIENIKAPQVSIQIADITLPGEKVKYTWWARNVKSFQVEAYPIDLFETLRKVENIHEIGKFPIVGKPVAAWEVSTGDAGDYQPKHSDDKILPEAPIDQSDAYLIVVRGQNPEGKKSEGRAVAIVSRLGLVAKTGKSKAAFLTMDTVTGEPRAKTQMLVQRFVRQVQVPLLNTWKNVYAYNDLTVPDSGLAELALTPAEKGNWQYQMIAIAREGKDYAVSDANHWGYWWGYANDGTQVYSFTDRPVYRPNQTVHFKQIVRKYEAGDYKNVVNQKLTVIINDARGQKIYEKEHVTSAEGSISGEVLLGDEPPLGMYQISINQPNVPINMGPGASFRVEEYKKPEFEVAIEAEKPIYKIGDKMRAKVHGEYYFGGPVANAKVNFTVHRESFVHHYHWPRPFDWFYDEAPGKFGGGGRWGHWGPQRSDLIKQGDLVTDAQGNVFIEIDTEAFPNEPNGDLQYRIDVKMVDESRREIASQQTIKVTRQAFTISLDPKQNLYQPGDTVRVGVKAQNANSQPIEFTGSAIVSFVEQRETQDESGKVKDPEKLSEISKKPIKTNAVGEAEIEFVGDKQGLYKVVVETSDPFATDGGQIKGTAYVWVAQGSGALAHYANRDLELVLERDTYKAGETMKLLLNTKQPKSYVLLAAEGDDLYRTQIVYVEGTQQTVEWGVDRSFRPNVMLRAVMLRDNKIFQEERAVKVPPVEQFLNVKIIAAKEEFRPREEAEVAVEVTDNSGQPVADAEFSLGAFDSSVLYIQPETRGDIRKFYYGRQREVTVRTTSSFFFRLSGNGRNDFSFGVGFESAGRGVGGGGPQGRMMRKGALMADAAPAPTAAAAPMEMAQLDEAVANDGKGAQFAETEIRTDFRDTIYWAAHLKTGSDGKAKAKIKFPDSLTTWRLTAIAADTSTRVGEVAHEVRTKKNILVRLQSPRFFIEGDKAVLSAVVHNYLAKAKQVKVSLEVGPELVVAGVNSADAFGSLSPIGPSGDVTVEVPAQGEKRVDFVAVVKGIGNTKLLAKALTDEESDAMQLEIPSYEYGTDKLLAESGILFGTASDRTATARLTIPEAIRAGSQTLTVKVSPTIAGVMLESLPYLLDYPYGCTEQTMSRFLPAVLTSNTLKHLGVNLEDLAKIPSNDEAMKKRLERFSKSPIYKSSELEKIIKAGVARLADFQRPDGGWGWWKQGDADPYMTAYVVSGLALAREASVALPEGMLERGVEFVAQAAGRDAPPRRYPWQQGEDFSLRAYLLYTLGRANKSRLADPPVKAQLRRAFENRDDLTDYARALVAIALADAEMMEEAQLVLGNIKDRARVDEQTGSVSWGQERNYWYWYDCGTEATSYSLKALIRLEPGSPMIPQAVNWLVRHRQGTRWFNTKDTAIACYALSDYLRMTGELDPDLTIIVDIDGQEAKRVRVTKENLFTFEDEVKLAGMELGVGPKVITIRAEGRGNVYWGTYASFFTKEEKIAAGGNELFITRQYQRLIPKEVTKTRTVYSAEKKENVEEKYQAIEFERKLIAEGEKLASGDLLEVVLSIDARNNFEYVIFEDPKPAGCEPTELQSGYQWGGGLGAHTELRDEKVAFFASGINQGKHTISYQLRAEIPGEFHALPAHGEAMYTPFVKGNGESHVIRIVDAEKK